YATATGVQTCALPIFSSGARPCRSVSATRLRLEKQRGYIEVSTALSNFYDRRFNCCGALIGRRNAVTDRELDERRQVFDFQLVSLEVRWGGAVVCVWR